MMRLCARWTYSARLLPIESLGEPSGRHRKRAHRCDIVVHCIKCDLSDVQYIELYLVREQSPCKRTMGCNWGRSNVNNGLALLAEGCQLDLRST